MRRRAFAAAALATAVALTPAMAWAQISSDQMEHYYPDAALRAQVEGVTAVQCAVTDDGHLKDCVVLSEDPTGYGFGDATVRLMENAFKLSPLDKSGKRRPPNSTFKINVRWQLPEDAQPPTLVGK